MSDAFYEAVAIWSQVIASGLFLVALLVGWRRFVAPAVVTSQARKNAELEEMERRRDAAREQAERARRELAEAEGDVHAIVARATADVERMRDRLANQAAAEGDRLVRNAEGELDRSRAAARTELRETLLDKALEIARSRAANLAAATDRTLVERALAAVTDGKHS